MSTSETSSNSTSHKSKNWFVKHKILSSLLALFVLGMAISSMNGGGASSKSSGSTTKSTSQNSSNSAKQSAPTKVASRQVTGKLATLGSGTFNGGTDVAAGLYDVTPGSGQSGNFMVSGTDSYNEILGTDTSMSDVPKVRVEISSGDKITISGLSQVTFTPVSTAFVTTQSTTSLYAGTFKVGEDVAPGRYTVTPGSGQSGNFMVDGSNTYNEILGTDTSLSEVSSLKVTLSIGDKITISGLSQVTFTPGS